MQLPATIPRATAFVVLSDGGGRDLGFLLRGSDFPSLASPNEIASQLFSRAVDARFRAWYNGLYTGVPHLRGLIRAVLEFNTNEPGARTLPCIWSNGLGAGPGTWATVGAWAQRRKDEI